ncbi:uncharacterized protein LOC122389942 [Amphibalanus amphitrite]|uniref:uncharacterized protein LOC122389942 n=1 Tax=Amphibalanus amphitrite TaxID=1232801 RepID=UPI001C91AE8A|nr:uncharacterized protein LOC122389942 [Amphibalanus amphitrite]
MYEYLVSQGMVKKLVRVREKKHLVQAIGEAFGVDVEDLMVRYYVAAFDDYVDLDNVAELPDQCRLQVHLRVTPEAHAHLLRQGDTVLVLPEQAVFASGPATFAPGPSSEPTPGPSSEPTPGPSSEPTPGPSSEPTPGPSSEPTPGPSSEPTPGPSSEPMPESALAGMSDYTRTFDSPMSGSGISPNAGSSTPVQLSPTSPTAPERVLLKVSLDDMSPKLRTTLQCGTKLKRDDWIEIGNVIYEKYVEKYSNPYPKRYSDIAYCIIRQIPNLVQDKTVGETAELIAEKLATKFRNKRRRLDSSASNLGVRKPVRYGMGLPQYAPAFEDSQRLEVQRAVEQLQTVNGQEAIDGLMQDTFADRRHLIVREKVSVAIIKERYGALFSVYQLWMELERMAGRSLRRESELLWARYLTAAQEVLGCSDIDRVPKAIAWALGDALDIYRNDGEGPGAVVAGGTVFVDGVEVAEVGERDALLVWAVALFVFSLKYPTGSRSTGRYLSYHVLGVEDEAPKDRVSQRFHGEVMKHM